MARRAKKSVNDSPIKATTNTEDSQPKDIVPASQRRRISSIYLEELASIWEADKRTPSTSSRRAWALARNLSPERVNNWWYRKKKSAKKNGISIPQGTYDLPVGTVPVDPAPSTPSPPLERHIKMEDDLDLGILRGDVKFSSSRFASSAACFSSGSSDVASYDLGSADFDKRQHAAAASTLLSLNSPATYVDSIYETKMSAYTQVYHSGSTEHKPFFDGFYFDAPVLSFPISLPGSVAMGVELQSPSLLSCAAGPLTWREDIPKIYAAEKPALLNDSCNSSIPTHPICSRGEPERSTFACGLYLPYDISGASFSEAIYVPEPAQFCIRRWYPDREAVGLELDVDALFAVESEPAMANPSVQLVPDPRDVSWCLGGMRYSYDGLYLGVCECAFPLDGEEEAKIDVRFRRYVGCTGPWRPCATPMLGLEDF
ncbi:hypothetical protein AX17_005898 [Amanita inopinata Kibby_2008]|nr:hypothetical protein AX17_005898 [Amanita inopinata Kibby_2008]